MLNIESVNGIIIAPDGSFKSFGVHSDKGVSEMTDINFHDKSFKMQLTNNSWFKKLKRKLGIEYTSDTIHRQIIEWTKKGVVGLIHAGAFPGEAFCILSSVKLSKEQRALLEKNYSNFINQLENKSAYF